MTHQIPTTHTIHKFLAIAAAAILTAASTVACSGSSLESAPFAPSAMPSTTLSAEVDESGAAFETLGKDKDKPKSESGSGSDSGKGKDKDTRETTTTSTVVEAEGAIVTATGECPAKTFTIGTQSFTTDAATTYRDGACAGLVALANVEVRATRDAAGTLTVTRVTFEETATSSTVVEAEGAIATATGDCPAKTFTIGTESFTTDAATRYEGGTCANLVALAEVEVRATKDAAGTLTVTRVEFEDADEADDEDEDDGEDDGEDDDSEDGHGNPHDGVGPFSGTVSMFRGSCPLVSFNLKGMRVSTTETTTYVGAAEGIDACSLLRPNVQVTVTGTAGEARRSFVAETITIDRTH